MFESIAVRSHHAGDASGPLDLGALAESMLFYGNVVVYANCAVLRQLVAAMGPELLIEYVADGLLKITYLENFAVVLTNSYGAGRRRHEAILASMPHEVLQEIAPTVFSEATGKSGKGRRLARRFTGLVQTASFDQQIMDAAIGDYSDDPYVIDCVSYLLRLCAPEYQVPAPLTFVIRRDDLGYFVHTNVDFRAANEAYHLRVPPSHSTLDEAYVLSHLLEVLVDLQLAAGAHADLITNDLSSGLVVRRLSNALTRRLSAESHIAEFQAMLFKNAFALREAINTGSRSFDDLRKLLREARALHDWIAKLPQDAKLLEEYISELRCISWLGKLPSRTARWMLFTGVGIGLDLLGAGGIGTMTSTAMGAFDAFVLDRLINGWKPNHFVELSLAQFVGRHSRNPRANKGLQPTAPWHPGRRS